MRCVIYCRKSTDREDKQIQSLHDQLRILKEFASREGLEVAEVFQEAHSAMKPGLRAEFNRMMAMVEKAQIDNILVYHINRLARNPVDAGQVSYALQTRKLQSIRTPDRTYLPHDSTLLLSVEYGMATEMSVNLSRTVTERMRMKAERGWLPGKPPVGYLNNYKTREIDPDPETFPLVKMAWELVLRGDMSISEIAGRLEQLGFRPLMTKWRRTRLLYDLFSSPFYHGVFIYKGQSYEGKHKPMISKQEFDRAQRLLGRVSGKQRAKSSEVLLYPGTMECLDCGCAVVGSIARKRKADGSVTHFHYYTCSGHRGCRKIGIREEVVTEQIERELNRIALPPEYAQFLRHIVAREYEQHLGSLASSAASVSTELEAQKQKLTRLTQMRLDGEIDAEEYKSLRSELTAEIERLQAFETTKASLVQSELGTISDGISLAEGAYNAVYGSDEGSNHRNRAQLFRGMLGFTRGKLTIMLGSVLEEIAIFKPRILSSPCPKLGDLLPANSEWYTLAKSLRTKVSEQRLSSLHEKSPRSTGLLISGNHRCAHARGGIARDKTLVR